MAKQHKEMDYAAQINNALREYEDCEDYRYYKQHSIDWICNRIDWCWKFRKITEQQMNQFCDRVCEIMELDQGFNFFAGGTMG